MSIFICEKCGYLDNTASDNNFWMTIGNKDMEKPDRIYLDEYFDTHICCSYCCKDLHRYTNGLPVVKRGFNIEPEKRLHWSKIGKEKLLEMESRHDGSCVNATDYFESIERNNL